jgi:hypothetical protein
VISYKDDTYLYNDGADGDNIDNDDIIDNGNIELEDDDIGTDDIDNFEGIYLISFLPSRIIISSRYQRV